MGAAAGNEASWAEVQAVDLYKSSDLMRSSTSHYEAVLSQRSSRSLHPKGRRTPMSHQTSDRTLNYPFRLTSPLDPPLEWERLRKEQPVASVRLPSGDMAVLLTRYEDVHLILSDPRFSRDLSQEGAARLASNDGGSALENPDAATLLGGESHKRWRRLMMGAFTVKRLSAMQPKIEEMANQLVDAMVEKGTPGDLVSAFAFPLPVWVIGELLGISVGDRDKLAYWSNTMLSLTQYTQAEIDAAQAEFAQYFMGHIAAKRARPGDNLLSELIAARDQKDQLTERELMMTGQGLLVAGHETTSNMIAKMMSMLLADRRRWERLLADPSLARLAVEEALRFDANAGIDLPRFITEDVELPSGVKLSRERPSCAVWARRTETRRSSKGPTKWIWAARRMHTSPSALARTRASVRRSPGLSSKRPSRCSSSGCRGSSWR